MKPVLANPERRDHCAAGGTRERQERAGAQDDVNDATLARLIFAARLIRLAASCRISKPRRARPAGGGQALRATRSKLCGERSSHIPAAA